jgi:hypothetical protein
VGGSYPSSGTRRATELRETSTCDYASFPSARLLGTTGGLSTSVFVPARQSLADKPPVAPNSDQAGRPGFWTSDDLLAARLRANRLSRPWGALGPTPEESWTTRSVLSLDEREFMWQHLKCGIAAVLDQREIDPTAALPHYTETEIERVAAQRVLEELGLLHVTRRRIAPVF